MERKFFCVLAVLFVCIHLSSAQRPLGFVLDEGKKKVEIPFELYNNLIVVPVVLNGMLPLRFVVDTGVQTGILTQKAFSDILNLSYSRKYTIAAPGSEKTVEAYVTNNVSLDLPGIHGTGHALLVLEEDYLELRNYLGTDVHGILGYELFSRFIVKVNYEKKILTVSLPGKFKPKGKFQSIPMKVQDTKPYVMAEIELSTGEKIDGKFLMDSGASHGLLIEPASDPRIKVPQHTVSSQIGRGIGGVITGKVGRINSFKIGKFKLENPIVNFPDPNSYMDSLKIGRTKRNGTIGGEVLSRFTVVFNFSKEIVYLKRNSAFRKKFYYNLSGLTVKAKGSDLNTFEITEVRDQSAAKLADVKVGDIILSVNGVPAQELDLNRIIGFFNSKPGKKISLELHRNGESVKRSFFLEDQI
ncbi:MAG TPA: aspartyl protease family protein [Cyclobacteriaceae bacterium]|nr:aspartyl protease family protein [Cyclobacteriaceae bacterium]